MDPDQGSHLGIRCKPGEGRSIFDVEIHSACSPARELGVVNGKYIIGEGRRGGLEVGHTAGVI